MRSPRTGPEGVEVTGKVRKEVAGHWTSRMVGHVEG